MDERFKRQKPVSELKVFFVSLSYLKLLGQARFLTHLNIWKSKLIKKCYLTTLFTWPFNGKNYFVYAITVICNAINIKSSVFSLFLITITKGQ